MHCIVCEWPANQKLYVRSIAGGPRIGFFVCDDDCRQQQIAAVRPEGLLETKVVLGCDVFRSMWDDL